MKQISIIGFIILLLAAVALFMRDKASRAELQKAEKEIAGLSNKVAMTETLVMMQRAGSNTMHGEIVKYMDRAAGFSNRLARTSEELKQAQREQQTLRTDLQKETKKAGDGEARTAALEAEARALQKMIEGRNAEITRLTANLQQAQAARADFQARAQKAEADLARLQLDFTDEAALQAQLKKLKHQWPPAGFAKAPEMQGDVKGASGLAFKTDTKATGYYLEIQPDGTVKLVPPLQAAGAAGKQ